MAFLICLLAPHIKDDGYYGMHDSAYPLMPDPNVIHSVSPPVTRSDFPSEGARFGK
jgi:hypothetical protein